MPALSELLVCGRGVTSVNLREKRLYHQIHPLKLATDIGVTPIALYLVWQHRPLAAVVAGLGPPIFVSAAMMWWTPHLEMLKASKLGRYVKQYMTPTIEVIRLLTLVPMAYGAWKHTPAYIVLGCVLLVIAWCNGLIWGRRPQT
jgi:hypothetical protein